MLSPLPGLSMRRTKEGIAVVRLHYSADTDLTPERIAKLKSGYPNDAKWNQEMEIDYQARSGTLVYPEFSRAVHVIPDSQIPARGCRYVAIDPHPRTPCAFLWILIDRFDDWYVYRELWPSKQYGEDGKLRDGDEERKYTIKEYAETVAWLEGNEIEWRHPETNQEYGVYRRKPGAEKIILRYMDQAGKAFAATGEAELLESYAKRFARYGIECRDPKKSHETGEDALHELLKPRFHYIRQSDWPRLHIAASCIELQLELESHRYMVTRNLSDEKELKQQAARSRCHLVDCLRYLATARGMHHVASQES